MILVLLPGLDGTARLFGPFLEIVPRDVTIKAVSYPPDRFLNYQELEELVRGELPVGLPYVVVAESYSGPVAIALAESPPGLCRGIVLVSTFAAKPWGSFVIDLAKLPWALFFRIPIPQWFLRWLLMDESTPAAFVRLVREAVRRVNPEVLAARLREALSVDYTARLEKRSTRIVCLVSGRDRLLSSEPRRLFERAAGMEVQEVRSPHLMLQCAPVEVLEHLSAFGLLTDP